MAVSEAKAVNNFRFRDGNKSFSSMIFDMGCDTCAEYMIEVELV